MKAWKKKALAATVIWAVVAVGGGVILAYNARSQYAADKVLMWTWPTLALGVVGIWVIARFVFARR